MSTILPAVLQPGAALGTAPAALVAAPAGRMLTIRRAVFTNISAAAVTLTVTSTRAGGAGLIVVAARSIPPGGTDLAPELSAWVLNPGDALSATASAAGAINCFLHGMTLG